MARRKQGREVVYVERGGDASAKWLFWGAVLGAGLALLYAPRTGEETRRSAAAQAVEAARDDRGEAGRAGPAVLQRARGAAGPDAMTTTTSSTRPGRRRRSAPGPGRATRAARHARSSSAAWPNRARGGARPATSRSRSPETGPARRVAPDARRLSPPHPAGRRRKQHSVPGQRPDLRRAPGRGAVRPAGADRPDAPGAGRGGGPAVDPTALFHRFFPPTRRRPGRDPFALVEGLLIGRRAEPRADLALRRFRRSSGSAPGCSRGCAPRSTTSTTSRPGRRRRATSCCNWLAGKARDIAMVVATVVLFLVNTALSTVLAIALGPGLGAGHSAARVLLLDPRAGCWASCWRSCFSVSLFYVTYRYASLRRLPWRTALLASTFTAVLFEVAKRLYGLYLTHFASIEALGGRRQHRRGGAVRSVGLLHGHRLPARRGGRRDLGAAPDAAAATRHSRLTLPAAGTHRPEASCAVPDPPCSRSCCVTACTCRPPPSESPPVRPGGAARRGGYRRHPGHRLGLRRRPGRGRRRGVAAMYLPDAHLLPPNLPPVEGREAIQQVLGRPAERLPGHRDDELGRDRGPGRLAYARGHYTLRWRRPKPGNRRPCTTRASSWRSSAACPTAAGATPWTCTARTSGPARQVEFHRGPRYILRVPQVRRAPAREPRQDLAGSSAKRCPVSLRGA